MNIKLMASVFIIIVSCNYSNKSKSQLNQTIDSFKKSNLISVEDSSNLDSVITGRIFNLPEINKIQSYIDSISNHLSHIAAIIQKRPSDNEPYFYVQVGYVHNERFEVYYNFYVYKKDLEIKYLDPVTNEILSLDEWRKH